MHLRLDVDRVDGAGGRGHVVGVEAGTAAKVGDDVVGPGVEQREELVDREVGVAGRVVESVRAGGVERVKSHPSPVAAAAIKPWLRPAR